MRPHCEVVLLVLVVLVPVVLFAGLSITDAEVALLRRQPGGGIDVAVGGVDDAGLAGLDAVLPAGQIPGATVNRRHAHPVCSAGADGRSQSGLLTVSDKTAVPAKVVTAPRHGKGAPSDGPGTPPEPGIAARQDWHSPGSRTRSRGVLRTVPGEDPAELTG